MGKGSINYMVVTVDYFTKWVEVEELATIISKKVQNFVWKSIVCCFNIPYKLASDNAKKFDSYEFQDFCDNLGIMKSFTVVRYLLANGQAEMVNKTLNHMLKTKLKTYQRNWPKTNPQVVWFYYTTTKTTISEIPFVMTYGTEAMIAIEIGLLSHRKSFYDLVGNEELM